MITKKCNRGTMPFDEEHELSLSVGGANDAFWFLDKRLVVGGLSVVICRFPSLTHCLLFLRLLPMLLAVTNKYPRVITDMVRSGICMLQ